jgi:hypothetical protein
MDDDHVRIDAHTSVTDAYGERHVYSFSHICERGTSDAMLAETVFRLCVEMATRMVKRNHLFGCTIGPLRVDMISATEWEKRFATPISSSSSSKPRHHPVSGWRLLE